MIIDRCRDIDEFKTLYNSIDNSNLPEPDKILALKDYCFCFYEKNKLVGVIYLEGKDGKIYLSGFSKRHNLPNILNGLSYICDYFKDDDIYSETPFKHAKIVLKKVGFTKLKGNIYIKRSNNGK